jgi:branched-chain amino acid transport system ATP-binding protein
VKPMLETVSHPAREEGAVPGGVQLEVCNLEAWYEESHVLHGVSLDVRAGEVVTLLGRNGAGKTTTLRAIMGMIRRRSGSVRFEGEETIAMPSRRIARLGIGYVPEERGIFASLSVEENLLLPPVIRTGGLPTERVFAMFPNLKERLRSQGSKLSGGEQQMLALGRILRTGSHFLLLDEPTEGLAPVIVQQIGRTIEAIKQEGFTILLVEQNFHFASAVADRHFIMEQGRVVDEFTKDTVAARSAQIRTYLGI